MLDSLRTLCCQVSRASLWRFSGGTFFRSTVAPLALSVPPNKTGRFRTPFLFRFFGLLGSYPCDFAIPSISRCVCQSIGKGTEVSSLVVLSLMG